MTVLRVDFVLLLTAVLLIIGCLKPVNATDFEPLDEIGRMGLKEHLETIRKLAPQLRTQLRSVRMTMKFDVREIHNIERSIGKSQTDIERLLAMHETDRVNAIRVHFLLDDLRRKAATLDRGLAHVMQRILLKYGVPEQTQLHHEDLEEQERHLLSLLQDYTQLVNLSLRLVSGEAREKPSLQAIE